MKQEAVIIGISTIVAPSSDRIRLCAYVGVVWGTHAEETVEYVQQVSLMFYNKCL